MRQDWFWRTSTHTGHETKRRNYIFFLVFSYFDYFVVENRKIRKIKERKTLWVKNSGIIKLKIHWKYSEMWVCAVRNEVNDHNWLMTFLFHETLQWSKYR